MMLTFRIQQVNDLCYLLNDVAETLLHSL